MSNLLKLNDETKNLIMEVSALSGIPQNVVKEVLEYMLISWAIKISDSNDTDNFAELTIPYVGEVNVKYSGDQITPEGDLSTNVDCFINLSDSFRKLVGDLHDEARTELVDMLQKKIEQAVMVASTSTD